MTSKLIRPYTAAECTFTITIEQDDLPPRGHAAAIQRRLKRGDVSAWCWVRIVCTAPDGSTGQDSCGAISLEDPDGYESGTALERRARAYVEGELGMSANALADMNAQRVQRLTPTPVRACVTSAKCDVNGNTYVSAKHVTTGKRKRVWWDVALDERDNHAAAARDLLGALPSRYASMNGGGYLFTVDPSAGRDPNAYSDD